MRRSTSALWAMRARIHSSEMQTEVFHLGCVADLSFEGSVANARLQYPEYVDPCFGGGKPPRAGCRLLKFPIPERIRIQLYPQGKRRTIDESAGYQTIDIDSAATIEDLMAISIRKAQRFDETFSNDIFDYVLKFSGSRSYLAHIEYPLLWFTDVQSVVRETGGEAGAKRPCDFLYSAWISSLGSQYRG